MWAIHACRSSTLTGGRKPRSATQHIRPDDSLVGESGKWLNCGLSSRFVCVQDEAVLALTRTVKRMKQSGAVRLDTRSASAKKIRHWRSHTKFWHTVVQDNIYISLLQGDDGTQAAAQPRTVVHLDWMSPNEASHSLPRSEEADPVQSEHADVEHVQHMVLSPTCLVHYGPTWSTTVHHMKLSKL